MGWRTGRLLLAAALVTLAAAGCGGASEASEPKGTVTVVGTEMAFTPPFLVLDEGTYTFVFDNQGDAYHELAIEGSDGSFHGRAMTGPHERASFVAELRSGKYEMVCREPGHYEAGMRGPLTVR